MTRLILYYVGHASGTKHQWIIKIAKEFLCYESDNKFNITEYGTYVDQNINKKILSTLLLIDLRILKNIIY